MDFVTLIGYLITPLTGVIGWFAGTRQRNRNAITEMQEQVRVLIESNNDYVQEIVALRGELAAVKDENNNMKIQLEHVNKQMASLLAENKELVELRKENKELRALFDKCKL